MRLFVLPLDQAAGIAADAGLPLVIGVGREWAKLETAVAQYRRAFRPSVWETKPYVVLAASVAIADTSPGGRAHASTQRLGL